MRYSTIHLIMIGKCMKRRTRYKRLKLPHYREIGENARKNMTNFHFYVNLNVL